MTASSWSQAICEACWLTTEPYTVRLDDQGLIQINIQPMVDTLAAMQ